ncbi:DUF1203 domain-containing protein [Allosediminivita pacifica]|uniref:Uncharacterized protein DUF1203 n=1 Tax=Allosediminivita pacifica TaxID=1267769 RepID=A0A2T6BAF1_9RHOB|nr:DUF1203 domain-containing protein [Allosediminivita pacifica]PTX53023.1 uncharacterized protein DUF1203 [Allosediminivita pacifica]GGA93686.1 hypothetical protein GCM10011324_00320 [Allosediminivita pacifica]
MAYRITGLDPAPFRHLWHTSEASLAQHGARRVRADTCPGYPDRITLSDAPEGATLLLMNHISMRTASPYRASHAIFLLEGADAPWDAVDALPPVMRHRLLSLRGFDADGMMRDADVSEGVDRTEALIDRLFADPAIHEIHAHNARQGCFAARITRA